MMQTVKKIDVLSMGKFMAVYMALAGLLMGIMQAIILSFVISMLSMLPVEGMNVNLSSGWLPIILYPLIFGILGFIAGALCALLYNLIAKISGGIKIDLETEGAGVAQPAQPQTTPATRSTQQQYQQYQQYYQQRR